MGHVVSSQLPYSFSMEAASLARSSHTTRPIKRPPCKPFSKCIYLRSLPKACGRLIYAQYLWLCRRNCENISFWFNKFETARPSKRSNWSFNCRENKQTLFVRPSLDTFKSSVTLCVSYLRAKGAISFWGILLRLYLTHIRAIWEVNEQSEDNFMQ